MRTLHLVLLSLALRAAHAQDCQVHESGIEPLEVYSMTPKDIETVVYYHNYEKGHMDVKGDNQQLYQYSEILATNAMAWARQCLWKHTEQCARTHVGDFYYVGENLAAGSTGSTYNPNQNNPMQGGLGRMMQNWAGEKVDYHWQSNTCNPGKMCGHYTQMIWYSTTHVGCAMTKCPRGTIFDTFDSWYLVCQYGPGGNMMGEWPAQIADGNSPCNHLDCGDNGLCSEGRCTCPPGFSSDGQSPCTKGGSPPPSTGCSNAQCSNHGQCSKSGTQIVCRCDDGWTGRDCATEVRTDQPCDSNPCLNGGSCTNEGDSYRCSCVNGYSGLSCEKKAGSTGSRKCSPNPCKNGGTCRASGASFACTCANGFSGSVCQTPPKASGSPSSPFLQGVFKMINQERSNNGLPAVKYASLLANDAQGKASSCVEYGGQGEAVIGLCGITDPAALDQSYGEQVASFWAQNDFWFGNPGLVEVGCAVGSQPCQNQCGDDGLTLDCRYTATEGEFKVPFDDAMDHGRVTLGNSRRQMRRKSHLPEYAIVTACCVFALVALSVAIVVRRRRAAPAAAEETLVATDAL